MKRADYKFENLVNYDKSKTDYLFLHIRNKFENLVNYDKSKTAAAKAILGAYSLRTL